MEREFAIITGASSGLGMAYAKHLAQRGWNLLLTGRRNKRLQDLKLELENNYKVSIKVVVADFSNERQFSLLLSEIERCERIDLLVNNAGYGCRKDFFEETYNEQQCLLNVHVIAATRIIHKAVPKMRHKNKGAIINVASLSAFIPAPLNYFYCSAKSFMVSFSECLHIDLAHTAIKIQALCPGFIHTEFHSKLENKIETNWLEEKALWMYPDQVVSYSLRNLDSHHVICIPGSINQVIYQMAKFLPKKLCYWLTAQQTKSNHQAIPNVA